MKKEEPSCSECGGKEFEKENRKVQFKRIFNGLKAIFPSEYDEKVVDFTRNFIGFGPNYMHVCKKCGTLKKIIPDGRRKY